MKKLKIRSSQGTNAHLSKHFFKEGGVMKITLQFMCLSLLLSNRLIAMEQVAEESKPTSKDVSAHYESLEKLAAEHAQKEDVSTSDLGKTVCPS